MPEPCRAAADRNPSLHSAVRGLRSCGSEMAAPPGQRVPGGVGRWERFRWWECLETPALGWFLLCSFGVRLRVKTLCLEMPSGFGFVGSKTSLQQSRGGYRPAALLRRAACPRVKSSECPSGRQKCKCP